MTTKPSYLALLNGVSQAESRAHVYLGEWAKVTPRDDVRAILNTVAAREGEHGMAFAKRINELGFQLEETHDPEFSRRMQIAQSSMTDLQKLEALDVLKYAPKDGTDGFAGMLRDITIDIPTSELIGRYIAEERDSIRLLIACHTQLAGEAQAAAAACAEADTVVVAGQSGSMAASEVDQRLSRLEAKLDQVCSTVERLAATLVPA